MLETFIAGDYARRQMTSSFGENLRKARQRAALSVTAAAERARMRTNHWANLEARREGLPEGPTLVKVAVAVGCSVDDLLIGVDANYDPLRRGTPVQGTIGGAAHGADSARVLELQQRIETYNQLLEETEGIARRLVQIAAHRTKGLVPRSARSGRRGRDRKAG